MAASSGITDASRRHSDVSLTHQNSNDAINEEFGSFTAAERLSDPFGDVYGAEAEFGDFEGSFRDQETTVAPSMDRESSSLMSFSPLMAPAVAISSENDPFVDITGIVGTGKEEDETKERIGDSEGDLIAGRAATVPTSTSTATLAILDLVWGNTNQETDVNRFAISPTSAGSGRSRSTSNSSGAALPLLTSTQFATFSSMAVETPENSTDLLSFSPPVAASAPIDPFVGLDHDTSETSTAAPVFDKDEAFTVTATPPLSTISLSTPTSLCGSFVSLHDDVKTPGLFPFTPGSVEVNLSPRDPFAERTTRSFRSLSSSFVSAGMMEDKAGQNKVHASVSTFSRDTLEVTSPSSAPPSLRSSFKMTDGLPGFAHDADESDEADPFAEAGLTAPVEVPLAEALAVWRIGAENVMNEDGNSDCVGKCTEEKDAVDKYGLADNASNDSVDSASVVEGKNDVLNASGLTKPVEIEDSLCDWTIATERNEAFLNDPFTTEHPTDDVTVLHPLAVAEESDVEDDENAADLIANDNEVHVFGLQDDASDGDALDGDALDIDESDAATTAAEQTLVDANDDPFHRSQIDTLSFTAATMDSNVESTSQGLSTGDFEGKCSSLDEDEFDTLLTSPPSVATDLRDYGDKSEENAVVETTKNEDPTLTTEANDGDSFGDFGGFEATSATTDTAIIIPDASPWGSFPSPAPLHTMPIDDVDAVGDVAFLSTTSTSADTVPADDGFGDFTQSTEPSGDDDFDDFGDFEQSSANDGDSFTDFQQSCAEAFGKNDNGFGDFTTVDASTLAAPASLVPSLSKSELSVFFEEAFPMKPLPAILLHQPETPTEVEDTDSLQQKSTEIVQDVFRDMWNEYISTFAGTGPQSFSSSGALSTTAERKDSDAHVLLNRNTKHASKYLKYVLSEKIQEASKQNGIFTHGSERHQVYVEFAASGDADRMCAALKELRDALFHSSVHDAMMRIAKQAALSAKAKIAEQAAQQHANSRGGSLFSTTRHLLSRSGNSGGAHGSSGTDSNSDHVGADTPTGVSVQKLARYTFTSNHDNSANAHRGANNGEERVSDGSDHTGYSSGSDSEAASSVDSRTRSQTSTSGSSNGGLMKKFQNRFSFGSSRHRPRFVSLRRKGQSSEEVRKMELNLDAISGGLDEVKWKCALFLYDVEEVTHVAPSQISILAYPSKQPLTGKTNRSALTKLVKPDTIWTVDIGANNSDMINEW
ncbi:hypothetical protein KXD40_001020 [Peronospora effusa]|uniref:Uncharacterized protein n=1 Tax=Peronospora effusa TaxID=542832 RepID=A0A3M6VM41_9STRA|nr:hypothetical protein DD238_000739 [Peronospora effusa]RQM17607.1 hypothetical protein DD237_001614 [Peronospora effusa]UIZ20424.1 hypothetical protein KXD40_001020 [Peronospora effusa]CAI5724195.1 unnamed protein product [Peronospora effusa]